MRSKLFVPGTRPDLFAKALAGPADALSFDLEDSVAAAFKAQARAHLVEFLATPAVRASDKVIIVRVNAPDSDAFEDDVAALAGSGIDLLNLPKIESPAALRSAVGSLQRAESRLGVATPARLLVNIETPRALANAADIAAAHPRVAGLQLGLADLFEPHGIDRHDVRNVHAAMFAMRMAAAQHGVFAMDAAFAAIDDIAGFEAEAAMSRALGYVGKSCIHPSQVGPANAVFAARAVELEAARRLLVAAGQDENLERGAFRFDGRMVDAPFLARAQALLDQAGEGA